MNIRLVPVLVQGRAWCVVVARGSRKKGTLESVPVSEPIYTLAQAQTFVNNNRASDFADALRAIPSPDVASKV